MTTMTGIAPRTVDAPTTLPPRFGLLSAAVVVDDPSLHMGVGYEYVPEFCGPANRTAAACITNTTPTGSASVSVSGSRGATLTLSGVPAGAYPLTVAWGDGATSTVISGTTATHTYAATGTYQVGITGGGGYTGAVSVTVGAGPTGPFTGTPTVPHTKTSTAGRDLVVGDPFAVYHLATCRTVATLGDARVRASRSLALGESRAVEQWMAEQLLADADDVTPAGFTGDIADAIALLEAEAYAQYGGQVTLHGTRAAIIEAYAHHSVERYGDHLETCLGSRVSAGGYDAALIGGSPSPLGPQWVWATGTVMLRRGPVMSEGPVLDVPYTNESAVLAERAYEGSWECFALGVKVDPSYCCAAAAVQGQPQSAPTPVASHATSLQGPADWTPPSGANLRSLAVTVVTGSATVDGADVSAPDSVTFDADTGETVTPPSIHVDGNGDRVVVSWVVAS